jgi:hypothetical protein
MASKAQEMQRAYALALRGLTATAHLPGTYDAQRVGLLPPAAVHAITIQVKDLQLLLRANYRKWQEANGSKKPTDLRQTYAEIASEELREGRDWPQGKGLAAVVRGAKRRRGTAFNGQGLGGAKPPRAE